MTSLECENPTGRADDEGTGHHSADKFLLDAGSIQRAVGRARTAGGAPPHRWRAFALLAVAYFMTIVDLTIVNVALPTIGQKLHFSESNLQWVVTAYGLTFGGFLLLGGRAADLLGRRRLFMVGMAVFTAASFADALSRTESLLIVMRGIQGLGAALVLPAVLSIVMNMFRRAPSATRHWECGGRLGRRAPRSAYSPVACSPVTRAGPTSSFSTYRSERPSFSSLDVWFPRVGSRARVDGTIPLAA